MCYADVMAIDLANLLFFAPMLLVAGIGIYEFRKQSKRSAEINRAFEQRTRRKAEADKRLSIYEENYQREGRALKQCVLDDLKAISCGKKPRLDLETLNAVRALQARQGEHPQTLTVWASVIADLSGEIRDTKAVQARLNELLYPETLEDVEALNKRVTAAIEKRTLLDPEALEAAKALSEIRARDARRKREEAESEAAERRREKEADKRFAAGMDEGGRASARNILRLYGLPETMLDGLPLDEVLIRIRALRENNEGKGRAE